MISFSLPHYTLRRYGLSSECDTERDPALFPRGFAAFASPAAARGTARETARARGKLRGKLHGELHGKLHGRAGGIPPARPCSPSRSAASGKRTMRPPQPRPPLFVPLSPAFAHGDRFFRSASAFYLPDGPPFGTARRAGKQKDRLPKQTVLHRSPFILRISLLECRLLRESKAALQRAASFFGSECCP